MEWARGGETMEWADTMEWVRGGEELQVALMPITPTS